MITQALKDATDDQIRQALKDAAPPTLRGVLYFLTRDEDLADIEMSKGPGLLTSNGAQIDRPQDLELLQRKGFELLRGYRDGRSAPPDPLQVSRAQLRRALIFTVGMDVPEAEMDYWTEELAFDPHARQLVWDDKPSEKVADFRVIVIGAGLGGINAAIQLKLAGFDYQVFERNAGVGGTWYQNTYPGARVDLPSRMYSHLFGVKYPWQHMFATATENETYCNWCVDEFGVRDNICFNTNVLALTWDDDASEWIVRTRDADGIEQEHRANGIISAGGLFDRRNYPNVPGIDAFQGIKMHSTQFDNDLDLSQSRVAVIGTGASGAQMVPDLVPLVKELTVFQRTPGWVLPFPGYRDQLPEGMKWLDANLPFYTNFSRVAMTWLSGDHDQWIAFTVDPDWEEPNTLNQDNYVLRERCVAYLKEKFEDRPDLFEKCLPNYPPLTKRFILDNGYYDALRLDTVRLVTDSIDRFEADGIVTVTGEKVALDVVIFATGYRPNAFLQPMDIHGRNGITPAEIWAKDGGRAYWGVTVPGLPNFFCIYGPNTNGKISGPVPWGEMQTRYALTCFKTVIENDLKFMDVRRDAYESFNEELDRELEKTIWMDNRQTSYYKNEFGRSATNAPWKVAELWAQWRAPKLEHYETSKTAAKVREAAE